MRPHDTENKPLQEYCENEQVNSESEETSTQSTFPALTGLQPTLDNSMPTQVKPIVENNTLSQRETADMVMQMVTGTIAYHVESGRWYSRMGDIMVMSDDD